MCYLMQYNKTSILHLSSLILKYRTFWLLTSKWDKNKLSILFCDLYHLKHIENKPFNAFNLKTYFAFIFFSFLDFFKKINIANHNWNMIKPMATVVCVQFHWISKMQNQIKILMQQFGNQTIKNEQTKLNYWMSSALAAQMYAAQLSSQQQQNMYVNLKVVM